MTKLVDSPDIPHAAPFGPAWSAHLYRLLLAGPDRHVPPPRFIAGEVAKGGAGAERYRLNHLAKMSFREAGYVLALAGRGTGCMVSVEALTLADRRFEAVPVNGSVFQAWRAEPLRSRAASFSQAKPTARHLAAEGRAGGNAEFAAAIQKKAAA